MCSLYYIYVCLFVCFFFCIHLGGIYTWQVDIAELRQKLQAMETLEKEVELLRRQKATSEQAALSAHQRQSSGGVWGWLAGSAPDQSVP